MRESVWKGLQYAHARRIPLAYGTYRIWKLLLTCFLQLQPVNNLAKIAGAVAAAQLAILPIAGTNNFLLLNIFDLSSSRTSL